MNLQLSWSASRRRGDTRGAAIVALAADAYSLDDLGITAAATVGVVICYPQDDQTGSELFLKADTALYAAKRDGKGRYPGVRGIEGQAVM